MRPYQGSHTTVMTGGGERELVRRLERARISPPIAYSRPLAPVPRRSGASRSAYSEYDAGDRRVRHVYARPNDALFYQDT